MSRIPLSVCRDIIPPGNLKMTCARGKAAPSLGTKLRLFADSGGFCQKPDCLTELFLEEGGRDLHIAEMAHIFSAMDRGPRAKPSMSQAERGAYENLLLLCPTCHTIVDKAAQAFPDYLISRWKQEHKNRIAAAFGAVTYSTRSAAHAAIKPLLLENRTIFRDYGPLNDYRHNPESEQAAIWSRKVLSKILPNNRKLLAILDANRQHLGPSEQQAFEEFRQHVDDLESSHIGGGPSGKTFPLGMETILVGEGGHD